MAWLLTYIALTQLWYVTIYLILKTVALSQSKSGWTWIWFFVVLWPVTATLAALVILYLIRTKQFKNYYDPSKS